MLRYLFLVFTVSLSALGAVRFLHDNPDVAENAANVAASQPEVPQDNRADRVQENLRERPLLSGTERLRADGRGHYIGEFLLNSSRVTGVIDTGATAIALNRSAARRAGVHVTSNDFVYQVNTANGTARAAMAVLDEVRLGSIRVRNVEAMILEDDSLDIVLIGMSFLRRLRNFEFANGTLEMKL
ncbi:retropepsin-like aspartic protease family protein [Oricola cellulosilytica]|uniref:TIGR02281 family clan AA aspartic protease n=1 Tax=Oricola cellulosilytica TaxID=1429082 RepID=A0A4R0PKI4_9HYPH|nr:TIGR02281 family clan AA aspartic protease [Oricola cellulosilytica]TCD16089.1 TIGR02281 family clan AA aspartic protease [Oricola cellulosilytica]